mgnify:CR=1 FL=1
MMPSDAIQSARQFQIRHEGVKPDWLDDDAIVTVHRVGDPSDRKAMLARDIVWSDQLVYVASGSIGQADADASPEATARFPDLGMLGRSRSTN